MTAAAHLASLDAARDLFAALIDAGVFASGGEES